MSVGCFDRHIWICDVRSLTRYALIFGKVRSRPSTPFFSRWVEEGRGGPIRRSILLRGHVGMYLKLIWTADITRM